MHWKNSMPDAIVFHWNIEDYEEKNGKEKERNNENGEKLIEISLPRLLSYCVNVWKRVRQYAIYQESPPPLAV